MEISIENIRQIIINTTAEYATENNILNLINPEPNSRLYGSQEGLDSLGLVILIGELEEKIDEELDIQVTLADEKAMSQSVSPFRSINALANYIYNIINNEA